MYPKTILTRLIIAQLFFVVLSCSQKKENSSPETKTNLENKTNKELFSLITTTSDKEEQEVYIQAYLDKAKRENNIEATALGYHFFMNNRYYTEEVLVYADSIIDLTSEKSLDLYPAAAYQAIGDYYFIKKAHKKALENYLQVSSYAKKHHQDHMLFRSKHNIAIIKSFIGSYEEALIIAKENLEYPLKNRSKVSDREYLISISSVAYIYNELKNVDSATYYNRYGLEEAIRLKNDLFYYDFALNQGISAYHNDEIETAIDSFQKHIPQFKKIENLEKELPHRLSIYLFYFGESYFKLNQKEKGIPYFKLIDSIFVEEKTLFPSITDAYSRLIDYYKEENDPENQLVYLNRLIEVNDILHSQEVYLNREIFTEYDIPKLKAERDNVAKKDKLLKNTITALSIVTFILIIGFGVQYRKRQIYKKRFQKIIDSGTVFRKKESLKKDDLKKINIPDHIVKDILDGLNNFETKKEFISNKITLNYLSKKLGTNPNYLSKVINHYKKTSFTIYLSNLRIEYTIEQLKENSTFRKYTIKAIASEVGFNNVQSFTKAFHKSKGINPSFFLKELKKVS